MTKSSPIRSATFVLVCILVGPMLASAQYRFEEATLKSGLKASSSQPSEIGPGPVVFDYDNDGWDDIYTVGGTSPDHLWHNNHDGTFTDVADSNFKNKFNTNSYTRGGCALDYDNDGLTDIYVCCERHDFLLHNLGGGKFEDATKKAQLITTLSLNESNAASFGDFDGDGDNDIFVARWIEEYRFDQPTGNAPTGYAHKGFKDYFYVNHGNGTFAESAGAFHIDGDTGCGNIALFFDYDRDGDLDLLVGNDFGVALLPNAVYKNMLMETGTATFVDVTDSINMKNKLFCMGIAPNDFNRDGKFDFYETNIGEEYLMQNMGDHFENVSAQVNAPNGRNRGNPDYMTVSWTPLFYDYDNDGWEDAFIVHGFEKALSPWLTLDPDTSEFIRNVGGTFIDYTDSAFVDHRYMDLRARGGAMIDYDKDGFPDILYGAENQVAGFASRDFRLFHNVTPSITAHPGHVLEIKVKAMRTAKEGIGTIIDVWEHGIVHSRQVSTGGGFTSMSTLTQHIGLGTSTEADSIIVYWPADKNRHRQIDRYYSIPADQLITFEEKMDSSSTGMVAHEPLQLVRSVRRTDRPASNITVYPQPAASSVTFGGLPFGVSRYEVMNLLGQRVATGEVVTDELRLETSSFASGTYSIRFYGSDVVATTVFIKE
ncbi:MAG: VCBS repeat-containing protein [Bacteroidetes bacterium]|nr:VCBS repeat-containing protein [Bacteroidota bacterium]